MPLGFRYRQSAFPVVVSGHGVQASSANRAVTIGEHAGFSGQRLFKSLAPSTSLTDERLLADDALALARNNTNTDNTFRDMLRQAKISASEKHFKARFLISLNSSNRGIKYFPYHYDIIAHNILTSILYHWPDAANADSTTADIIRL